MILLEQKAVEKLVILCMHNITLHAMKEHSITLKITHFMHYFTSHFITQIQLEIIKMVPLYLIHPCQEIFPKAVVTKLALAKGVTMSNSSPLWMMSCDHSVINGAWYYGWALLTESCCLRQLLLHLFWFQGDSWGRMIKYRYFNKH